MKKQNQDSGTDLDVIILEKPPSPLKKYLFKSPNDF